jgi:FkbM family methyltransferase
MIQFLNSLQQIVRSDSIGVLRGVQRHLGWQLRKLFHGFPCELSIGDSTLFVDRPCGVAALVNAMGKYDYNNMSFLSELLSRFSGTFVDVGANLGTYTLVASEVESARVISIEAHPRTFALLLENVHRNGRRNVTCLNVALSNHDGDLRLTDGRDPSLNHVLEPGEESGPELNVPCRRMDTLCRELKASPDLVKIDVEGHERAVLAGLSELAGACKVIIVEHGEQDGICEWMGQYGFAGPLFAHFNSRELSPFPQPRREDPLFVRETFLPVLLATGFRCSRHSTDETGREPS